MGPGAGEGDGGECLMGDRVSVWEMESSGSGWCDGCTTVGMYLMPLNCILKDG